MQGFEHKSKKIKFVEFFEHVLRVENSYAVVFDKQNKGHGSM